MPPNLPSLERLAKNVDRDSLLVALLLRARAEKALQDERDAMPAPTLRQWVKDNRRINGQPFDLDRFKPLEELYGYPEQPVEEVAGLAPDLTVIKAAQRGVSEFAVNRALYTLDVGWRTMVEKHDGLNVGYLFPTKVALGEFSKERITPIRDETDHMAGLFGNHGDGFDAVGFKQVGKASFLFLRGMNSLDDLRSFRADLLVYDEFDRMSPRMVSVARKRLNASDLKHQLRLSTPSVAGWGVAAVYDSTDKRVWRVPCSPDDGSGSCGWEGEHDFLRDVALDGKPWSDWRFWKSDVILTSRGAVLCPNCGKPSRHWDDGRWVRTRPEGRLPGYYVPWYGVPFVGLPEMAANAANPDPTVQESFWQDDLGIPYSTGAARVDQGMVLAAVDPEFPADGFAGAYLGVDPGIGFHVVVARTRLRDERLFVAERFTVSSWAELTNVVKRYNPRHTVIDAAPETNATAEWAQQFPGKVTRVRFQDGDPRARPWLRLETRAGEKTGLGDVDRTQFLDRIWTGFGAGAYVLDPAVVRDPDFADHLGANTRTSVRDEKTGQEKVAWRHTRPDHWAFALGMADAAREAGAKPPGVIIKPVLARNRGF